jgi:hypothetical protein
MTRLALCIAGASAALAACVLIRDWKRATRRVPVKDAATMLRQAWADHHTVA